MRMLLLAIAMVSADGARASCAPDVAPVIALDFGSRYTADDPSRSTLDAENDEAVTEALRPVDTFIRKLAWHSNRVLRDPDGERARATCIIDQIGAWAMADALSDLGSFNAQLAVGSRLAGIAEIYRQVRPLAEIQQPDALIEDWLVRRAREQIDFWEIEATSGARNGNLRAWATLAIFLTADLADDDFARYWAYASAARILCTARPDGSLPQETGRGKYALHYQFHAVTPLVMIAAHARGGDLSAMTICDGALERAVTFALDDYAAGGNASETYSGSPQIFVTRDTARNSHLLAWLPAWRLIANDPTIGNWLGLSEFDNSKLGGDQLLLWQAEILSGNGLPE